MRAVAAALGLAAATACAAPTPDVPPPTTTTAPPAPPPVPSTPSTAPAATSPPSTALPLPRAGRGVARTATTEPRPAVEVEAPEGNAGAMEQQAARLACIRRWESGGDYGAVSASGKYRGAYQFDRRTWQSNGGEGDPAAASPAEQDRVAGLLLERRGLQPWPTPARRCA